MHILPIPSAWVILQRNSILLTIIYNVIFFGDTVLNFPHHRDFLCSNSKSKYQHRDFFQCQSNFETLDLVKSGPTIYSKVWKWSQFCVTNFLARSGWLENPIPFFFDLSGRDNRIALYTN